MSRTSTTIQIPPRLVTRRSSRSRAVRLGTWGGRVGGSAALPCLLLAMALLAGCGAGGPGGGRAEREPLRPRHVFLITVDTLRADHLGAYGYSRPTSPNLDRLAQESLFFQRAIAQWPKTGPSFASLFTGQYPLTTGLTHQAALELPAGYLTLPEFFKGEGFTTLAVVSNGVLSAELGWNAGFDEFLETWAFFPQQGDSQTAYRETMNAQRVNELALPLLAKHKDDERLFVWVHYSDPHTPYLLPPGYQNPFLGDAHYTGEEEVDVDNPGAVLFNGHRDLKYYVAQYDANVLLVDREVEALLDQARELGLLDDACVLFTADHGESLGEHGYYLAHGRLPYNPAAHVPLFIRETYRPAPGGRVERPVELVDLYPTLRDLVAPGKEVPGLEGKSLVLFLKGRSDDGLTPAQQQAFRFAFSQAGGGSPLTHFRSIQERGWKLIYHPPRETRQGEVLPATWELYDLARDPLETANLLASGEGGEARPEVEELRRALFAWMGDRDWIRPPKGLKVSHSEQTMKALKALGYVN